MVAGGRGHCLFIDHQEVDSKILNIAHIHSVCVVCGLDNCDAESQIILNLFSYYFVI